MNVFAIPALISAAYHTVALIAGIRKTREPRPLSSFTPALSVLKPVRGVDERFADAVASHAVQDYPEFEIVFGTSEESDRREIERIAARHPGVSMRVIVAPNDAPNGKVGILERLAAEARYPVILVNDSDILVRPRYFREAVAPLQDPSVGLVTCLYRGGSGSFAGRSEALGIATEFGPSVLVARQVGVNEFAMGSTLVFRQTDLQAIGGFAIIREFLADDYQLGKKFTALGRKVVLGFPVVETWLGSATWKGVWKHQERWSRTIRVSRPTGYFGYAVTHTIVWCLFAALTGNALTAALCYLIRAYSGLFIAGRVLQDSRSLQLWWWMPARDLFGFASWLAGLTGSHVEWRGLRLQLESSGRIRPH